MIGSVQKALQILSIISNQKGNPITLKEISEQMQIPKPTCSHLLETLRLEGYVKKAAHSGGYTLGPSLYHLTRFGKYEEDISTLCRPVMRWLESKTGATVALSIIENEKKYIIEHFDNYQKIYPEHWDIMEDSIYRTATGRVIMAFMPMDKVYKIWEKLGPPRKGHWEAVKTYKDLQEELLKIRTQTMVITDADPNHPKPITGFACPILKGNKCIAALGIAWSRTTESDEEYRIIKEKLYKRLLLAKKEIERRLNYEKSMALNNC